MIPLRLSVTKFQSTLPVWGATSAFHGRRYIFFISIHAPRVGSDVPIYKAEIYAGNISIHAPRVGSDQIHRISVP